MRTISDLFPGGACRGDEARLRLAGAYNRVFFKSPSATPEDHELVLSHLATVTRFFFVDAKDVTADEMRELNGKRQVMALIVRLGMGEGCDLSELYQAVVRETAASNQYGDI